MDTPAQMTDSPPSRVEAAVWPWRQKTAARPPSPSSALRRRGLIQAALALAVALFLLFVCRKAWMGRVVLGVALFLALSASLFPPTVERIERGTRRLGQIVAAGLTWILLAPLFYVCFTLGHVAMALAGKDPLARRFPSGRTSNWTPRPPVSGPETYRRQY